MKMIFSMRQKKLYMLSKKGIGLMLALLATLLASFVLAPVPVFGAGQDIILTAVGDGNAHYSGDGGAAESAGLNLPINLTLDKTGNIYIADYNNHCVRKVDCSTGNISTVAGTGVSGNLGDGSVATSAALNYPCDVAVDSVGNLFIADSGNHKIRKVDHTTGYISTIAGSGVSGFSGDGGKATEASLNEPRGIAFDIAENLYIVDTNNHRIRKIDHTTGVISTVAGNGSGGFSGDGGIATVAKLYFPKGIAVSSSGDIYISDHSNHRIRKVDHTTGYISTVAGKGSSRYSGDGGLAINAEISYPCGIVLDGAENLFIADCINHRIRKVDHITGIITTVAGIGTAAYSGDGGNAAAAALKSPQGVDFDSEGNLYIADSLNHRIRKVLFSFDGSQKNITSFSVANQTGSPLVDRTNHTVSFRMTAGSNITALTPRIGVSFNATLSPASGVVQNFSSPVTYLVTAPNGTTQSWTISCLLEKSSKKDITSFSVEGQIGNAVLDTTYHTVIFHMPFDTDISALVPTLSVSAYASISPASGTSRDFSTPVSYMVTAQDGSTADWKVTCVVKSKETVIQTIAGNGTNGYSGDGSPAFNAGLNFPKSFAFDNTGNIYIADCNNHRIRKVDHITGNITTVAGNGTSGYSGDGGPAASAGLNNPTGVAVDGEGNIYIADSGNNRIRRVDPSTGIISTFVGNGIGGYTGDDGPAVLAELNYPTDVLFDSIGNLYIVDSNNSRIRKVALVQEKSTLKSITSFSVPKQVGNTIIDNANHTVSFHMASGSIITALLPTITLSPNAKIAPLSGIAQNFSSPVTYIVTAQDGTTQAWVVTCIVDKSSNKAITSFKISNQTGTSAIDAVKHTITFHMAAGSNVSALIPTIKVSLNASISPLSGTAIDFTNPVTYIVTAQDGTTRIWTVTCIVDPSL